MGPPKYFVWRDHGETPDALEATSIAGQVLCGRGDTVEPPWNVVSGLRMSVTICLDADPHIAPLHHEAIEAHLDSTTKLGISKAIWVP